MAGSLPSIITFSPTSVKLQESRVPASLAALHTRSRIPPGCHAVVATTSPLSQQTPRQSKLLHRRSFQVACSAQDSDQPQPDTRVPWVNGTAPANKTPLEELSPDAGVPLANIRESPGSPRRSVRLDFTCNKCQGRSTRYVNPLALKKGAIFMQCSNCGVIHKFVDNLGLIEEVHYNKADPEDSGS